MLLPLLGPQLANKTGAIDPEKEGLGSADLGKKFLVLNQLKLIEYKRQLLMENLVKDMINDLRRSGGVIPYMELEQEQGVILYPPVRGVLNSTLAAQKHIVLVNLRSFILLSLGKDKVQ